jgi:hypothetical protein
MATEEGTFTIPSSTLVDKGKVFKSNPLTINVIKGSQKLDENKYFIAVELDQDSIHVGQQIVMSIKLYSTITIERYDLIYMPDFNDVFIQELPRYGRQSQLEVVDGVQYQTQILKRTALYPQKSGRYDFDGLVIRLGIPTNQKQRRGFFFSTQIKTEDVTTNSFGFDVFPLPEPKPNDFSGGVGQYTAHARIDRTKLSTDDALTLTMTIQGDGDQRLLLPPVMDLGKDFDSYDANLLNSKRVAGEDRDRFTKVFEYLIIPNTAGSHWLKPHFTYFSPDSDRYVTIIPDSFLLDVAQGTEESRALDKFNENQKIVIHPIIHTWNPVSRRGYFLSFPVYWSLWGLLLSALFAMIWFRRLDIKLANMDPSLLKSRKAQKVAQQRLLTAKQHLDEGSNKKFFEEIALATKQYLSDKLKVDTSRFSRTTITKEFENLSVSDDIKAEVIQLLNDCDLAIFASSYAPDMAGIYNKALYVVEEIEKALEKR